MKNLLLALLIGILIVLSVALYSNLDQDVDGGTFVNTLISGNPLHLVTPPSQHVEQTVQIHPPGYVPPPVDVLADFNAKAGSVSLRYGVNENDNWMDFARDERIIGLHRSVGSRFIRIWVSNPGWRESTIPYGDPYNYQKLDELVNAALRANVTPIMVFAHAPRELSMHGVSDEQNPPRDVEEFARYAGTVLSHYRVLCDADLLAAPCNTSDWYVEVWNEPWEDFWWDSLYPRLFRLTKQELLKASPGTKIGGYSLVYYPSYENERLVYFLEEEPDFISIHHYGNSEDEFAGLEDRMRNTKVLYHDLMIELSTLTDKEIIMSEYSLDWRAEYMQHLDELPASAYLSSALIWMIRSGAVDIETFYSGTSLESDSGFGLWGRSPSRLWPTYEVKRLFAKYNTHDSIIYSTVCEWPFDCLTVENEQGIFVTIVNKEPRAHDVRIGWIGRSIAQAHDPVGREYPLEQDSVVVPIGAYRTAVIALGSMKDS